jgi:hypothetical protein
MITEKLVDDSLKFAYSEIDQFGLPTRLHFDLSLKKGKEIAAALKADVALVQVGVALMDIKLGEAFSLGRLGDHVQMGVAAANQFLADYDLTEIEKSRIINSIEAHHGSVPFNSLESEIVTNADCYRFMHPAGVIHYIGTLSKRGLQLDKVVEQAESKLDEKHALLSLEMAKLELIPAYDIMKQVFVSARAAEV